MNGGGGLADPALLVQDRAEQGQEGWVRLPVGLGRCWRYWLASSLVEENRPQRPQSSRQLSKVLIDTYQAISVGYDYI
jgi:hypothetical protein